MNRANLRFTEDAGRRTTASWSNSETMVAWTSCTILSCPSTSWKPILTAQRGSACFLAPLARSLGSAAHAHVPKLTGARQT